MRARARGMLAEKAARHARLFDGLSAFDFERVLRGRLDVPEIRIPSKLPATPRFAQAHAELGILPAVEIEALVEAAGAVERRLGKRRVARAEKGARIVRHAGFGRRS